jgi:hypothetical protein
MAPPLSSDELHELVQKLDTRVKQLEEKLREASGGAPKPAGDAEGVRMILMGPPGAGTFRYLRSVIDGARSTRRTG